MPAQMIPESDEVARHAATVMWCVEDNAAYQDQLDMRLEQSREFHKRATMLGRMSVAAQHNLVSQTDYRIQQLSYYNDRAEVLTNYADTMALARPTLHSIRGAILRRRAQYFDWRASMATRKLVELNSPDL